MKFRTILLYPPQPETLVGKWKDRRHRRPDNLTYNTMTMGQIRDLPVPNLADAGPDLGLWTTTLC
jgi:N6-adenosine-specific RNA methylase IME4